MIQDKMSIYLTYDFAQDVQDDIRIVKSGRMVRGDPFPLHFVYCFIFCFTFRAGLKQSLRGKRVGIFFSHHLTGFFPGGCGRTR